jgi:hypothetical protein
MGSWRTLAFPKVERAYLIERLEKEGLSWRDALHVTATNSLGEAVLKQGDKTVTVDNLIDLISLDGLGPHFGASIDKFPVFPDDLNSETLSEYRNQRNKWFAMARAVKAKHAIVFDQFLSRYMKGFPDSESHRIMRISKIALRKSIQNMENAGLGPEDIRPRSNLAQDTQRFWRTLANSPEYRYLSFLRSDFWQKEPSNNLQNRISGVLARFIKEPEKETTIFFHGFYFYTPVQWALFRTLRKQPNLNLVFVVHDDGESNGFESWRRFFGVSIGMPSIEYLESAPGTINPNSRLFEDALGGRFVNPNQTSVEALCFENPTHFVRHLRYVSEARNAQNLKPLEVFGAREKDLQRFTQRLSGSLINSSVALYQLPVGMFLVSLHACLHVDDKNDLELRMNFDDFMNMVPYLIQSDSQPSVQVKDVAELREFFSDCESMDSWRLRAKSLVTNAQRIKSMGNDRFGFNALSMLPWAGFTERQAEQLRDLVIKVCSLVAEIGQLQSVGLDEYSKFLKKHLEQALKSANPELHEEILSRMEMFNLGDDFEIEVSGLVEIVRKLVGRESAYDDDEDATGREDRLVKPLRALDALPFMAAESDVLLANLSDKAFPAQISLRIWPFEENEVVPSGELATSGFAFMRLNVDCASLGDLYLLSAAFEGVPQSKKLFLSWMEESMGEKNSASPAISMLLELDLKSKAIREAIGGLSATKPSALGMEGILFDLPAIARDQATETNLDTFSALQLSAAAFCEKRFALQWAMGDAPAFQSKHLQDMLYGNMVGYLSKAFRYPESTAISVCNDFWPHLPESIKVSSMHKRVIKQVGISAHFSWIYTLAGWRGRSINLRNSRGRQNAAYQTLIDGKFSDESNRLTTWVDVIMPGGPFGSARERRQLCNMCPVSKVCSSRDDEHEED